MIYNPDINKQIDEYSTLFDRYVNQCKIPEKFHDDTIVAYMRKQVWAYSNQLNDEIFKETPRNSLLKFFRAILPSFLKIQENERQELRMLHTFFNADIQGKRAQWKKIQSWLSFHFPKFLIS